MEKAKLAILEAEINKQREEIGKIYLKIIERSGGLDNEVKVESLAYHLHNLYCAYEDLFKIVAETFENNIEEGVVWHKELLRRMTLAIEDVRPSLISEESLSLLSELRAFRHFFRHAYIHELDANKVKLVLEKTLKLKDLFKEDIDKFMNDLRKT